MKINKTLRLEEDLVKKIQEVANKENRTFTNMVEELLKKAVKK